MYFSTAATAAVAMSGFVAAIPINQDAAAVATTEQITFVAALAPQPVTCDASNDECRTAEQAAPFIFASFAKYGVVKPVAQAAVLAFMSFETDDFRYKRNMFPGRPGQGTATMHEADIIRPYAESIPEVASAIVDFPPWGECTEAQLNEVLDLVTVDEYNFASGAWYLMESGECAGVYDALLANADDGFRRYEACSRADAMGERLEVFQLAKTAFGV